MQRLLLFKLASSNLSKKFTNNTIPSLFPSHPYKAFTSISKPAHPHFNSSHLNPVHHFLSSCQPCSSLSGKIRGFISNPSVSKPFFSSLTSTHFRVLSKRLADSKVGFLRGRFDRGYSSRFNPNFGSYRRGWRSWLYRLTPDDGVLGLIIANVAVFMLWRILDQRFMQNNFMISLDNFRSGRIHTLITYGFSHLDAGHIIYNMIALYFFGTSIGRKFGTEFLLKLYLAGTIGGAVFYLGHHAFLALSSKGEGMWGKDFSRTPALGASGAVNAIMLLDIFLHPRATIYFNFFIPVPAILVGIFLIGKDILRIIEGDSNISGSAHLGGVAVAAIAWARIRKGRF